MNIASMQQNSTEIIQELKISLGKYQGGMTSNPYRVWA
jgi:hypothetical protein